MFERQVDYEVRGEQRNVHNGAQSRVRPLTKVAFRQIEASNAM